MTLAPIALTCGEPAGIGPEIAVAARKALTGSCPFFWIGDPGHLPPGTRFRTIKDPFEAHSDTSDALPVLPHEFARPVRPGHPEPENAQDVINVIVHGVDLVANGQAAALCTTPIHKGVLIDGAGFTYPGHTEFLAALTGRKRAVMMLASDRLRVVPTTIHIALREVARKLTPDLLRETIKITVSGMKERLAITNPVLAVAGLNPHAGERGAMGSEELDWIAPLVDELAATGLRITGPHPADSLFHRVARERYDVAICMYHDQALIPLKALDFDRGVNITLGLPLIRTSPDHGTALDIAGRGRANPDSLVAALRMSQAMAQVKESGKNGCSGGTTVSP